MMVLMMVALFGYQYYRLKINPEPVSPPTATGNASTAPSQPAPPSALTLAPATAVSQSAAPAAKPATPTVPVVQAAAETSTIIENELYRITFSNRGAQVTSWVLKQLKNSDGKPLDLVSPEASKAFGDPLSLYTADPSIATALNQGALCSHRYRPRHRSRKAHLQLLRRQSPGHQDLLLRRDLCPPRRGRRHPQRIAHTRAHQLARRLRRSG